MPRLAPAPGGALAFPRSYLMKTSTKLFLSTATAALAFFFAKPNQEPEAQAQAEAWRSHADPRVQKALAKNDFLTAGHAFAQLQRETEDMAHADHAEACYKLAKQNADALAGLAWTHGCRHEFAKSIAFAKQAIAADSGHADAWGIWGDAELELGNYEAALESYQKMMDLRPDLSSWSRGAWLLWMMGEKSRGIALMTKAVNAGGPELENTAWCQARLARMLYLDGALLPAEQALPQNSENPHVVLMRGKIAAARGDKEKAEACFRKLPSHPEALVALGEVKKLPELKGHHHTALAKIYADLEINLPEALRMAQEHEGSKNVYDADTLAWAYFKNGQLEKAVPAMKLALSQKTPDPELHYHAGRIAEAFGDLASARRHYDTALQMNPALAGDALTRLQTLTAR
jgi:tetratricopeptide (TPR) repeat protein